MPRKESSRSDAGRKRAQNPTRGAGHTPRPPERDVGRALTRARAASVGRTQSRPVPAHPQSRRWMERKTIPIEKRLARGPVDLPFLMLTLMLVMIGLIMVLSASYASAYYDPDIGKPTYYFLRQGAFAVLGVVAMFAVSRLDYQRWRGWSVIVLITALVLLLVIKVPGLGQSANGAMRWIKIPGLPQFQPSEFAKLGVILYFSSSLSKRNERKPFLFDRRTRLGRAGNWAEKVGLMELLPYGGILLLIILLLYLEPHMSATILILVVGASILFAAGISIGWFLLAGGLVGGLLVFIISATSYMSRRVALWRDPWIDPQDGGFQAIQSLLAIGSGGLMGLGLGKSRQKFLYLPEEHNDFIFSVVCEELGFIGAGLILVLFALLILRGYWIALHARDRFGTLVVVGVTTLLAFQVFLNVAVVSNLFPVTGISLPFFSYGGTALVVQLIEMGIVLSVSRQIPAARSG